MILIVKFIANSGIKCFHADKLVLSTSPNVVDNRGEDLRFPISSSSGFSSPMMGIP